MTYHLRGMLTVVDDDAPSGPLTVVEDIPTLDGEGRFTKGKFGGLTPREAGLRGVESRRRQRDERERNDALRKEGAALKIRNAPPREKLKDGAAAVLWELVEKILSDEIEVRNARELASVADVFFNILRLESGQSTANVEHLTDADRVARLEEFRQVAAERKAAALDVPPA